ncbi:MAG: hypothetical protein L6R28_09330 [Planctomycetes bacterium]|nr:hypothetical protein [Planctomycetota bacterium]
MWAWTDKTVVRASGRLWLGAPALMVLATCVTSQAALADTAENADAGTTARAELLRAPGLSWAVNGGVTHSVEQARLALARKAACVIHALDRITCAHAAVPAPVAAPRAVALPAVPEAAGLPARLDPARSQRQTSAP